MSARLIGSAVIAESWFALAGAERQHFERQTTNLGVRSSNLFGRATSQANHTIIFELQKLPCRTEKSAWHLHGCVQVRCNSAKRHGFGVNASRRCRRISFNTGSPRLTTHQETSYRDARRTLVDRQRSNSRRKYRDDRNPLKADIVSRPAAPWRMLVRMRVRPR